MEGENFTLINIAGLQGSFLECTIVLQLPQITLCDYNIIIFCSGRSSIYCESSFFY